MHSKQSPTRSHSRKRRENVDNKPLVQCSYGWKRQCTLYRNRIDVDGTSYALDDLVHVRSIYRTVLNVPSIRLELCFRTEDVVLRGIAAIEDARSIIAYLETYCTDNVQTTSRLPLGSKHRKPAHEPSMQTTEGLESVPTVLLTSSHDKKTAEKYRQEYTQAVTAPLVAPEWLRDLEPHVVYTREQQRTKANRSIRKYGYDVQELAQQSEADTLPSVTVPLRLLPQEKAHYCANATLASTTPTSAQGEHPSLFSTPTDHGRLVLTNKRIIYIGRTGQVVIDYTCLTHVSRLRNSLTFCSDHWSKSYVFEMDRPLECALYLDKILRQFQQQIQHQVQQTVTQKMQAGPHVPHTDREATLHQAHAERSTQPRYNAYARQSTDARTTNVVELEDIETLPLSLLKRSLEVVE